MPGRVQGLPGRLGNRGEKRRNEGDFAIPGESHVNYCISDVVVDV